MVHDVSPATDSLWLPPDTLWPRVQQQTQRALDCGALEPIPTTYSWLAQDDVQFLVRVLANLQRKAIATQQQPKDFNPFLPYDPNLFVADLSPTHLVLLNKFNVMDHHVLIVTRAFESQDTLLTLNDFQALALGLSEIDGLAFYNGGMIAGASQRHKHLQIVPLPFVPDGSPLPLDTFMRMAVPEEDVASHPASHPQLPYRHAVTPLQDLDFAQPLSIAAPLLERYRQLLAHFDLISLDSSEPLGAYNLLVTRQWLCVVPRSQESFADIPVNALGFTGTLLVRTPEHRARLAEIGPMTLLTEVGYAR
jgi:sulfate adenylyltransferase (ADP) / ATP adenylyltransferase